MRFLFVGISAWVALACSGSSDEQSRGEAGQAGAAMGGMAGGAGDGGTAGGGTGGASGTGGTVDPDGWMTLLEGDWELEPGTEDYYCIRKTIPGDLHVQEIAAINPPGTHHTVLTVGSPSGPDGIEKCEFFTNARDMVFGSGVGTNPLKFPDGVTVKIDGKKQLLLNLHLFNATANTLRGTSGTRVRLVPESEVKETAETILMGTFAIFLPPMQESIAEGDCVQNGDVTLFAVQPHMHQLGTHMKVTAKSSIAGDVVIHDSDYDFEQQLVSLVDPVPLRAGDRVNVECTYMNPGTDFVTFGDSTLQEMCFAAVYRHPPHGTQGLACADE